MFGRRVNGKEGAIRIVELGAVIGQIEKWELIRETKGDDKPTGFFTFRAQLGYINKGLFADRDYTPVVFITTGRDQKTKKAKQYRLEQADGRSRTIDGRSLLMEGVKVCP